MRGMQQQMDGLVSVGEGIRQDSDWAITLRVPHKHDRESNVETTHTPTDHMMTLLSLLALARNFPLWPHSTSHTSSLCTCSIAVVMRGNMCHMYGLLTTMRNASRFKALCDIRIEKVRCTAWLTSDTIGRARTSTQKGLALSPTAQRVRVGRPLNRRWC